MMCFCCDREIPLAYHVQLRGDVRDAPTEEDGGPNSPRHIAYAENATYRSAFVCPACYGVLDSPDGTGEIAGRVYAIAGQSRGRKAALYNEAKYQAFRRKKAAELGIEPD